MPEAVNYYEHTAQDWELQTLIRSRAAAGSHDLYSRLAQRIAGRIFRTDVTVQRALASVRIAKEKIDQQHERNEKGFDVKLGRGGIREIEFIAQALQIAFGGRDPWLRAPHTLITLGRLADRELISKREHSQLSDAYHFLRKLEHRLQMEHGLQTHALPIETSRRELVARRMNFSGDDALSSFETALAAHTTGVRAAFDRIFGPEQSTGGVGFSLPTLNVSTGERDPATIAAHMFAKHTIFGTQSAVAKIAEIVRDEANASLNPHRALSLMTRVGASLGTETEPQGISEREIRSLIRLCGISEPFGEMIARRPSLIHSLPVFSEPFTPRNYSRDLGGQLNLEDTFAANLEAIRQEWSRLLVEIGARDAANNITLSDVNRLLTQLAAASIDTSLLIARRKLEHRYEALSSEPRLAVLALGRLGSGGMDYGSDLDIIIVYDSKTASPIAQLTHEEAYPRLAEFMITALSSITREGYLYRVDLRLRPEGQKGPLASGSQSFIEYVKMRAEIWEWLAYVKLRAVAGDLEFGRAIESTIRKLIHERARQADRLQLVAETRRVRDRLEKEKA
ncbi:MAG TPA: hypothetical protein VGU64_05025, partial [Terriglobales bacterium]|nr:hypothetical protein [Terriglobales bacterium]